MSGLKRRELVLFSKDTLIRGQPASLQCVEINNQVYSIGNGFVRTISLEEDWFEDVADPQAVIAFLEQCSGFRPDIFTFWQRVPDTEPKYSLPLEWEELAVLPVKSYVHWWNHQIKSRTRNQIRKAERDGLVVRVTAYDDDFVRGMTAIFNETATRQGRKFWHYGKDFRTVKEQFSRYIHREDMIGAFYKDELVGFIMMANAGRYAVTRQIISAVAHRDKSVNNALIAKAVELCERKGLPYLVYLYWGDGSLTEFKRRCGFEKVRVPRYFVPITRAGRLALKLWVHRGWAHVLPAHLKTPLKRLRNWMN